MKKIYIITYDSMHIGEHLVACNYFENKTRAELVKQQYENCGHTNVKVVELLSEK